MWTLPELALMKAMKLGINYLNKKGNDPHLNLITETANSTFHNEENKGIFQQYYKLL